MRVEEDGVAELEVSLPIHGVLEPDALGEFEQLSMRFCSGESWSWKLNSVSSTVSPPTAQLRATLTFYWTLRIPDTSHSTLPLTHVPQARMGFKVPPGGPSS